MKRTDPRRPAASAALLVGLLAALVVVALAAAPGSAATSAAPTTPATAGPPPPAAAAATAAPATADSATAAPATGDVATAADLAALAAETAALRASLATTRAELDKVKFDARAFESLALHDTGRDIYVRACATCHGRDGRGNGPSARYLDPKPRDFTTGEFKFRSTPSGTLPTVDDLARTIRVGVPGTSMPAWKTHLTPYQLRAVASYVAGFSARFASETVDPAEILAVPPKPPDATPASIAAGEQLYKILKCWDCHGTRGTGDGPSAKTLKDSTGKKIEAWNFTSGHLKSGGTAGDVYRTFNTGLDGTPMPSYADALLFGREAGAETADIAKAYGAAETKELLDWIATQPDSAAVDALDDAGRAALVEARRWALVHYVMSLVPKRGFLHYLFMDKPGRLDMRP